MAGEITKDDPQKKAMVKLGFYEMIDLLAEHFRTIKDCQACRERMRFNSDGTPDLGQPANCLDEANKLKGQKKDLVKKAREDANEYMVIIEPLED